MKLDELGKIKNILEANLPLKIENQGKMLRSKIGLLFLKMFDIDSESEYFASNLPYGKQRKLEIARA